MAKIGPKEAATRALAALRVGSKRAKPSRVAKRPKKAKARVASNKRPLPRKAVAATTAGLATPPPATPKIGRPSTGFDRVAYQRVYTRLRRLYGPLKAWPPAALSQLRIASTPTQGP